jgi:hypothetical protein
MKTYDIVISIGKVEAESEEAAREKAEALLMSYAESNDGSELLANSNPVLIES